MRITSFAVPAAFCTINLFALTGPPVIRDAQPVLQTFDASPRFSPGTWVQIFGTNLAGTTRTWEARDFNGPQAPTSLDGVSVRINGKAGYIAAISPERITVQVPDDDAVGRPVPIEVTHEGGTSNRVAIEMSKVSPALQTAPAFLVGGKQYLAALHSDLKTYVGRPNLIPGLSFRPAKPGDTIVVYAVGCGPTTPASPAGQLLAAANSLASPYQIRFGNTEAQARGFLEPNAVGSCRFDVTMPNVRGDVQGDISIDAVVDGVATGQRLFTTVQFSELAQTLSAAFREFAAEDSRYSDLHKKYFGVTLPAPPPDETADWIPFERVAPGGSLDTVLRKGEIRLGYVPEFPLHYATPDGSDAGFEFELGEELVKRIGAHYPQIPLTSKWVKLNTTLPVGPAKDPTLFNALLNGLKSGQYDVAFNGVLQTNATVAYTTPTTRMFPGVLYTGRDNLDVSGIHDRPSLVSFLIAHPGLTFVVGMGQQVLDALAADVAAGGSSIVELSGGGNPHFRVADILGLTKQIADGLVSGVLLDVNPRLDFDPKAPFTLPD